MAQKLEIINQESVSQDANESVHIVVKSHQFVLVMGAIQDLNKQKLLAKLIYDFEQHEEVREVPAVKNAPMEYKVHLDAKGTRATVEVKIHALTSQHEYIPFRVLFQAVDPLSREIVAEVYSHPIKVISKLGHGQVRICKRADLANMRAKRQKTTNSPINTTSNLENPLIEKITRLEEQQREQHDIMHRLAIKEAELQKTLDFDYLFSKLLEVYSTFPSEERSYRLRKALLSATSGNTTNEQIISTSESSTSPMNDNNSNNSLSISSSSSSSIQSRDGSVLKDFIQSLFTEFTTLSLSSQQHHHTNSNHHLHHHHHIHHDNSSSASLTTSTTTTTTLSRSSSPDTDHQHHHNNNSNNGTISNSKLNDKNVKNNNNINNNDNINNNNNNNNDNINSNNDNNDNNNNTNNSVAQQLDTLLYSDLNNLIDFPQSNAT